MRSPHQKDQATGATQYADRVYRSAAGVTGGVLLLALAAWLGSDAILRGEGRTPWLSLAGLLLAVPLIVAFTVRPAVYAGAERIRIRNPFRTITLPWSSVDRVRAAYSTELYSGTHKYQLWAIPVSLRARKRAARQTERAKVAGSDPFGGPAVRRRPAAGHDGDPMRSWSDTALDELRELSDRHPAPAEGEPRQEPSVRWCYEVIGPAVAGAIVLAVLLAV
jgi:hypothetical protein